MPIHRPVLPGRPVGGVPVAAGPVSPLAQLVARFGGGPVPVRGGMHQVGGVPGGLVQGGPGPGLLPAGPSRFVAPVDGSYAPAPYAPLVPSRAAGGSPYAPAGYEHGGPVGDPLALLALLLGRGRRGARFV